MDKVELTIELYPVPKLTTELEQGRHLGGSRGHLITR